MALVNMRDLIYHAHHKHYAVGAFDIVNLEFLQGVLQGAETCRAPVILNFAVPQFEYYDFELLIAAAVAGAQRSLVPVALHLDHAPDLESVIRGIRHGCNGVMIVGSRLSFEQNIELTRTIAQTAHGCGIPVVGELSSNFDYAEGDRSGASTLPDEVRRYVDQTEVDFLAVSIDVEAAVHPNGSGPTPDRLASLSEVAGVPLVIRSGGRLTAAQCASLISRGVARIDYGRELSQLAARRSRSNCLKDADETITISRGVPEDIAKEVERCLTASGAAGCAAAVLAEVSPWTEVEHLIIYNVAEGAEQQVEEMMDEGRRVLGAIPGVRRVFTGRALKEGAGYAYCWLVRFAHPKVVDSYREHPAHVAFADTHFRPMAATRISIDYRAVESAPAASAQPQE